MRCVPVCGRRRWLRRSCRGGRGGRAYHGECGPGERRGGVLGGVKGRWWMERGCVGERLRGCVCIVNRSRG